VQADRRLFDYGISTKNRLQVEVFIDVREIEQVQIQSKDEFAENSAHHLDD